ncbi:MAG TPA: cytochrome c [Rhizomicrobium sp.]|nr:cytochrome c [Rhizomicrobium sp.]
MKRTVFLTSLTLILFAAPALAADKGETVFEANCSFCHQAGGVGVPGQFPRLEGRAGRIAGVPEGRRYLLEVMLNGMAGRVTVDGQDILGVMPSLMALSDTDLAAVLTYVTHLGNTKAMPFTTKDVAAARALPAMAPGEVAANRAKLIAAKVVP